MLQDEANQGSIAMKVAEIPQGLIATMSLEGSQSFIAMIVTMLLNCFQG